MKIIPGVFLGLLFFLSVFLQPPVKFLSKKFFQDNTNVRAVVLIDQRLYAMLQNKVDRYLILASARRQFGIVIDCDKNLDDYHFTQTRELIRNYYKKYDRLEGILFIGNIKPPSFYKTRADILQVRYYVPYFEDLDLELGKHYTKGTIDPFCTDTGGYYCQNRDTNGHVILEHDFDEILTFPASPELWTAYMPAGKDSLSTFTDYAQQLSPYFDKLIRYYSGKYYPDNKMYMISNDIYGWDYNFWLLYKDMKSIDYFGMNPDTCKPCMETGRTKAECYQRVSLENYHNQKEFLKSFYSRPWMGNGWQDSDIYTKHMLAGKYEFVFVNVHGREDYSMLKHFRAKKLQHGGLIIMGAGCSIAGYKLPRSPSFVQSKIYPDKNILLSYLYGASEFRAAFGTSFWRGHAPHYEIIIYHMKNNGYYLGKANRERMRYFYSIATDRYDLRENQNEYFLGDPFMDVHQN